MRVHAQRRRQAGPVGSGRLRAAAPRGHAGHPLLTLQQTAGNRAARSLVSRQLDFQQPTGAGPLPATRRPRGNPATADLFPREALERIAAREPEPCPSTDCSVGASARFDDQPCALKRALSGFENPQWWFEHLGRERQVALVQIYNRMCRLGLWSQVRLVLGVRPGEKPAEFVGRKFKVAGNSVAVDFEGYGGEKLRDALIGGRSCIDMGIGGSQHATQVSTREKSTSDSLHVSIGPGTRFDAHIDLYSSPSTATTTAACTYDVQGTVAHLGRELVPEKLRKVLPLGIPWELFPDFGEAPSIPRPEPTSRHDTDQPPLVGFTYRGPLKDRPARGGPAPLPDEVARQLAAEIRVRVRRDALQPPEAVRRLGELEEAREMAGPDEEPARVAELAAARARHESFADAQVLAMDLAQQMDLARREGRAGVVVRLGDAYASLSSADVRAVREEIRGIAKIVRDLLDKRAAGVNTVWIVFGDRTMWDVKF